MLMPYTQACEAVSRVADRAILLDDDGVDICFMNNIKFDRTVRVLRRRPRTSSAVLTR